MADRPLKSYPEDELPGRWKGCNPVQVVWMLEARLADRNARIQTLTNHAATSSKPKRLRRNARRHPQE